MHQTMNKLKLTQEDLDFNAGTAMWKGKELRHMDRTELYWAFSELGKLYQELLEKKCKK